MNIRGILRICVVGILAVSWASCLRQATAGEKAKQIQRTWNFDDVAIGKLPARWRVEATNQRGPLATWQVVNDKTAPSGTRVLALTSPNHRFGGTFNICWTDALSFRDGVISVRFKAVKGREDQGGGVIWRVQDKANYYIARFNPLEDNFRIYYVRDGARKTLADAQISLPAGKWHTLKIVQQGHRFKGYLNGKKLLDGTDSLFTQPGGVGLWTKADAVTSFDDFVISTSAAATQGLARSVAAVNQMAAAASHAKSALVRTMLSAAKVSLTQAVLIAQREVKGSRAYEAELDIENGRVVYEVKVVLGATRREVLVDAVTGKVVASEGEDDD